MPRLIDAPTEERIELGDLVEMLAGEPFDPRDEDAFAARGTALKKLANNRAFLGDLIIEELKQRCRNQAIDNAYTPQVIMLHTCPGRYYVRANIWPALDDSIVRASGTDPFFYGIPHDHNFSFLTVGYLGPGYWSDYYEYDYGSVAGHAGEKVDLTFVERARLDQGKVMLYRIHRDVHLQLPADAMSVSLNIVEASPTHEFRDQYRFDLDRREIAGILNQTSLEPLLALSAHFGGGEGIDLLDRFAARHPSDRVRFIALKARASAAPDLDGRIALFEEGARSENPYVSRMAAAAAKKAERGRPWLENAPAA